MRFRKNLFHGTSVATAFAVAGALAMTTLGTACSSDDDDGNGSGSGGTAGTAGKGGAAGKGGTAGKGGAGGDGGGAGGTAGSGGTAGGGGDSGAAGGGGGGAAGMAGTAGTGGSAGPWGAGFSGAVPLDATTNDRFMAVAFDATNRVYAAGYVTVGTDQYIAVARYATDGSLDTAFGNDGIASHNVKVGGNEIANGLVLQSDGKIVLAGTADNDPAATFKDADFVTVRFDAEGDLDTTYGDGGTKVIDLGAGVSGPPVVSDLLWSIARDGEDRLVLFGSKKADGRADRDRVVLRLTKDGQPDSNFATGGVYTLDVDGQNLPDDARNGIVQADGKIMSAGYTNVAGRNQVVLVRLNADGSPDTTFSSDGVLRFAPFAVGMAEAYAAVPQSDGSYVTTGYGRTEESSTAKVDIVSFRVSATGSVDSSWGSSGVVLYDGGAADNDRGRNLVVLPDDRVVMVGGVSPVAADLDAALVVLTPEGQLDKSWDPNGVRTYSFGQPTEQLYGVAVSADGRFVAAAGFSSDGDGAGDDDATLVVLPVSQ
jgi:uncharacterized delta-60 repeat protein